MNASLALVLVSGLLGGFWPTFGHDPMAEPFPLEAKGDIRFQVDVARFIEDGQPVVAVSVAIPDEALGGSGDSARILTEVELLDRKGKAKAQFSTTLILPPADTTGVPAQGALLHARRWLRLNPIWLEGAAGLRVRIEDLESQKPGLYDQMRKIHRSGEAAGRLAADPDRALTPLREMSDLLFVWGPAAHVAADTTAPGLRSIRSRLQPNPYRYYGLFQPVLTVYWERYPRTGSLPVATDSILTARYRILTYPDSIEVHRAYDTLRVEPAPSWTLKRFDLSRLQAGSYRCEVSLSDPRQPNRPPLAVSNGAFQVVWEKGSWAVGESQLLEYGRALLPSNEFERFSSLDRGGMESYLRELWERHSPTQPGETNETEQRFLERAAYASQNFRGQRSGILSDRGLIYIRFGPPDELREQLNPQDEELLWLAMPQEMADQGKDENDPAAPLSRPRNRLDNRAYQIWDYTVRGDPILPEFFNPAQSVGLKFIFVDEMGTGDYSLVYSSIPLP